MKLGVDRTLHDALTSYFSAFLERHGFTEVADPESGPWTKIFASSAFRLKFAGRGGDINVWADPSYRLETWYWIPHVLEKLPCTHGSWHNNDLAVLAEQMEQNFDNLVKFFSVAAEQERAQFEHGRQQ